VTQQTPPPASRLQRILAYIIAALVILSLVCIAAILIGTATGQFAQQGSGAGLWPTVFLLPLVALPIAFVLIIALLIVSARRNRAANRAAGSANGANGRR
jgi:TRAP-type C4-dicarboxylate transport system permease small subunit